MAAKTYQQTLEALNQAPAATARSYQQTLEALNQAPPAMAQVFQQTLEVLILKPSVSASGAIVVDWVGEFVSQPPTVPTSGFGASTIDWAGEFVSAPAGPTTTGSAAGTIDWTGTFVSAPPPILTQGSGSITVDFRGDFHSQVPDNETQVVEDTFTGLATIATAGEASLTAQRLTFPYEGSQPETWESRVTVTNTIFGAHVFDGGYFDAGRPIQLNKEGATRDEIEAAKIMLLDRYVHLVLSDGVYLCIVETVDAQDGTLIVDLVVVERSGDVGLTVIQ